MQQFEQIIKKLCVATKHMTQPASVLITKEFGKNPFLQLISCLLSLRTKDTVSFPASKRLFVYYKTPQDIQKALLQDVQKLIYPVGFYRKKAKQIKQIATMLIVQYNGQVPSDKKALLSLPGVGRKTMNLVLAEGFGLPGLCVDVHVHRISNRLGIVKTKTPEETEMALKKILPQQYWHEWSTLLVTWGQNVCVPISPFCSVCPVATLCHQVEVKKRR